MNRHKTAVSMAHTVRTKISVKVGIALCQDG